MIDLTFQTRESNLVHEQEIELARSILRTAQAVLLDACLRAYPVGTRVRYLLRPNAWGYYTVVGHTPHPTKWLTVMNDNTGVRRTLDATSMFLELVEYSYEVIDKTTGHRVNPAVSKDFCVANPEDYMFTSGDQDPLKHVPEDRRYSVEAK